MGPYVDAVTGDIDLPETTDVVIVGGGIIGVSAALELARRGIAVTLCEKGHIAGEQSSRNWGWCRQAGRDEREMPLITQSMRLWRDMQQHVDTPLGYVECGTIFVGDNAEDAARFEAWIDMAKPFDTGARLISGAEFEARTKLPAKGRVGLYVATDGCAEPQKAAPAIARAAIARGAKILPHCAVRTVERTAGRVSGVVTERGRIGCNAVIVAAGAWSSLICRGLDYALPQLKVDGTVLRTSRVDDGPESCTWIGRIGYRKRQDGGYTIADGALYPAQVGPDSFRHLQAFLPLIRQDWRAMRPYIGRETLREFFTRPPAATRESVFEQARVREPQPDMGMARRTLAHMATLHPAFKSARIVQAWGGFIDVTPDVVPYIGPMPGVPGLTVATGFSGHGFGIGPAAGAFAASLACGDSPDWDHSSLRVDRFSDGSPVVLGADI